MKTGLNGDGKNFTARQFAPGPDGRPLPSNDAGVAPFRLQVFAASELAGTRAPQRLFHVNGLIPARTVTLLGGDGATGKSLLALQLAAATALGDRWLNMPVVEGPSLFLTAEDDREEVHRRLEDIALQSGIELDYMTDLHVVTWAGEDALLAAPAGKSNVLTPTPRFHALASSIGSIKPALVVLDTLADLFGGEENNRAQARQFISMLRGLALQHNTTVLLLAHPSLSGMSSGSGTSGSTAWSNSVRSRLYLERVKDESGVEPNPDDRVLRTMKANYAQVGGEHRMRWEAGVFVSLSPAPAAGSFSAHAAKIHAEHVFVALVTAYQAEGRHVSSTPSANFAPVIFAKDSRSEGLTKRVLHDAMNSLFASKAIGVAEVGPQSRRRKQLVVFNHEVAE